MITTFLIRLAWGVRLTDGRWWWPSSSRMWSLLLGGMHVCVTGVGSSGALLAYLGVLQWFDLLNRGKFSFYSAFYRETSDWSDWSERCLPADVLREIALGIILALFWGG